MRLVAGYVRHIATSQHCDATLCLARVTNEEFEQLMDSADSVVFLLPVHNAGEVLSQHGELTSCNLLQ